MTNVASDHGALIGPTKPKLGDIIYCVMRDEKEKGKTLLEKGLIGSCNTRFAVVHWRRQQHNFCLTHFRLCKYQNEKPYLDSYQWKTLDQLAFDNQNVKVIDPRVRCPSCNLSSMKFFEVGNRVVCHLCKFDFDLEKQKEQFDRERLEKIELDREASVLENVGWGFMKESEPKKAWPYK